MKEKRKIKQIQNKNKNYLYKYKGGGKMKQGATLEGFIQFVYEKLLSNEEMKDVDVRKNYFYEGNSGVKHEFDVYYEMKVAKNIHKIAIECKDYQAPVEKRDVSEFYGKLMDCPGVQGIMVAQNGYRPTAEQYANHYNIKTITTKELPNICQIAAMDIKIVLLPDKETVGKPFWCIMEIDKDSEMTTGNYFILPDKNKKIIPLFLSKKAAEEVRKHILDKEEYQVYGIRKENLGFLCDAYKLTSEVKLGICPLLSSMIQKGADFFVIEIDGKELRQEFLE